MVRLIRLSRPRLRGHHGAVLVIVAAGLIMIVGLAALVLDILNVHQNRLRARATVDAAALAAAQDLPDYSSAVAAAKEYALRNLGVTEAGWAACTDSGALVVATVSCISTDAAGTEVRVRLPARSVPVFFASVFGKDGFSVSATAEKVLGSADGGPGAGSPGDGDPATPSVRDGDPGGGYPPCEDVPDWEDDGGNDRNKKWSEFVFVFEHLDGTTKTVCGTSRPTGSGNVLLPGAGGSDKDSPTGIYVHVSCSDIFLNGWTNPARFAPPMGPLEGIDTGWRVVRYTIDKYDKFDFQRRCGEVFTPVTSELPVTGPDKIRLTD